MSESAGGIPGFGYGQPAHRLANGDEKGVLAAFARLGKANTLPFRLGEVGAKAAHGFSGRRCQADQVAKMLARANSRGNHPGIAYCIAREYAWRAGRLWNYSIGHQPGEAALYTAGALIDGLQYSPLQIGDAHIQADRFGEPLMAWCDDGRVLAWRYKLDRAKSWTLVDVAGRTRGLSPGSDGTVLIELSESPMYILESSEYTRLAR